LKTVLGSELITDDEVAIFELVKNSFDARAKSVHLLFQDESILVADNGVGMTRNDLETKWLFVAYSAKRAANTPKGRSGFRDEVVERKHFAGSKGIGRFSSDRLGQLLVLQTRPKSDATGPVHSITVDWDRFDSDHLEHFQQIEVGYKKQPSGFQLPPQLPRLKYGTVIEIRKVRKQWDRVAILKLKSSLAKLINPFGADVDRFRIVITVPREEAEDASIAKRLEAKGEEPIPSQIVNGDVGNFIFSTLRDKTTFLEVSITPPGAFIESKLTDRGEVVYRIREPNPYKILSASRFTCELYFLNQSAKHTFARRMGLPSVQFGSVFLFRNGFRVFPVGNLGDDWFGIDHRKQQGYARFLGSRDIIGRIDVFGGDDAFQEASSRNEGLINTPAVSALKDCFREYCLKRLEKYIVPVTWVDKEDKNTEDLSRLLSDPGRARVAASVASLVDNDDVQLLEYSERLIGILNERSEQFEESLVSLRSIAEKSEDKTLLKRIAKAEARFEELRRSEAEARRVVDEERVAKDAAQVRASAAEAAYEAISEVLVEEKKRNLFLASVTSLDTETILNMHHQITIYAVDLQQQIENLLLKVGETRQISHSELLGAMEQISFLNRKVLAVSKFATKANFRLESEMIENDLSAYIVEYINGVARDFLSGRTEVQVFSDDKEFVRRFKPIDVSIVIDNLISNARKAKAARVTFDLSQPRKGVLQLVVTDDGRGIHPDITETERLFEKGFTKTDGSGLGLYHVRQVLGDMNGSIEFRQGEGRGASFLIRIAS
jgi:signal transduction histidine kinase